MSDNVLLFDADTLVYRAGFAAEKKKHIVIDGEQQIAFPNEKEAIYHLGEHCSPEAYIRYEQVVEPLENALHNINVAIEKIEKNITHGSLELYLTGKGNFRNDIATIRKYKGNRENKAKPVHYEAMRSYLIKYKNAIVVDGMEADDMLGIRGTELQGNGVLVTNDKDLDSIPGYHYNWVKEEGYHVSKEEAVRNFFCQVLTGDRTDNVVGIEGLGPKGAAKILAGQRKASGMLHAVREAWHKHYPSGYLREDGTTIDTEAAMLETARLVWIRRYREDRLFDWKTLS